MSTASHVRHCAMHGEYTAVLFSLLDRTLVILHRASAPALRGQVRVRQRLPTLLVLWFVTAELGSQRWSFTANLRFVCWDTPLPPWCGCKTDDSISSHELPYPASVILTLV